MNHVATLKRLRRSRVLESPLSISLSATVNLDIALFTLFANRPNAGASIVVSNNGELYPMIL
jgi:hypothetical protein